MTNTRVVVSILGASASFAALIYVLKRRARRPSGVRVKAARTGEVLPKEEPRRISMVVPRPGLPSTHRSEARVTTEARAILGAGDEPSSPTVQCVTRLPPPLGADDAEALEPGEIGSDWLARATQSERSLSEFDLELDIEDIAEPADDTELEEPRESTPDLLILDSDAPLELDIWRVRDKT